jgi:hypothetical protein
MAPDETPDELDAGAMVAGGMGLIGAMMGGTISPEEAETQGLGMMAQMFTMLPTDQLVSIRALINSALHDRGEE